MKYIVKFFIFSILLSFVACEKSLDEINIDPNNPTTALDANVLTAAQGYLGYIVDVDLNAASFLWAQYYTWGLGVSIGNQERFVAQPDDYNGYWSRAYASCAADLKFLTQSEDPAYVGVAQILQAYIFQGLVDHFGDVPYTEAVSGKLEDGAFLTPRFDDAASIYDNLITLIDDAIRNLNAPGRGSGEMGADDLVFGGNLGNWEKFANSLKLRLLMRLSETDPRGSEIVSLVAENNFITGTPSIPFQDVAGNQNPMFARFSFGVGDFYFASNATLNKLEELNDPRTTSFYGLAADGTILGINQGTVDSLPFTADPAGWSGSSSLVYGPDMDVILMSDWEVKFLRAEAAARYNTADNDADMLGQAIASNFAYFGVADAATYVSTLNYSGSLDEKLDIIGTQKWIALNGTQEDEGWIEARRFDRPASRLFTNGIWQNPPLSVLPAGTFPSSWLYPATERSLNPNAPAQRSITDKIFWDN